MSRIAKMFLTKPRNILNVYVTAGFPELDSTLSVMKALQEAGVDMIELGMPYSDPLADGPVIQASNARSISNGMTIQKLFSQLGSLRSVISVPVVLMGYMNPIIQYGFEKFCSDAAKAGVDGLILPDLPLFEFDNEYGPVIKKFGLDFIFLVTPETPEERVRALDEHSSGFLYAVSSSSTTGQKTMLADQEDYFRKLQAMSLNNPILIGFGIKDKSSFDQACSYANGAIIGTAFINAIDNSSSTELQKNIGVFIGSVL